jgi:hypothetical protein
LGKHISPYELFTWRLLLITARDLTIQPLFLPDPEMSLKPTNVDSSASRTVGEEKGKPSGEQAEAANGGDRADDPEALRVEDEGIYAAAEESHSCDEEGGGDRMTAGHEQHAGVNELGNRSQYGRGRGCGRTRREEWPSIDCTCEGCTTACSR